MNTQIVGTVSQAAPQELAERCLRSNSYPALRKITCDFLNGVLILRGCVETYYLKQLAQEVVASLAEPGRIDNQIQVVTSGLPIRRE